MSLASSKSLNILCDENTFQKCRNSRIYFNTDLEKEFVKGKSEKISMYQPFLEKKTGSSKISTPTHLKNIFSRKSQDQIIEIKEENKDSEVIGREEIFLHVDFIIKPFLYVIFLFLIYYLLTIKFESNPNPSRK